MNRQGFLARFRARPHAPVIGASPRGDHDLNPGLTAVGPLRPAAVLVPVIDRAQGLTLLFTRRTDHLPDHPGQISFPGGHIEPGDASPEDAALREAEEEVGLARERVQVLGRLDQYTTRTGFAITPVVGLAEPPIDYSPHPHEVAEVFEVPLGFFLDPTNHIREVRRTADGERRFYAFPHPQHYIWGATAGMLMNLFERLAPE